jgi:4-hydroxy-tetrahydrodipicolinate synthase
MSLTGIWSAALTPVDGALQPDVLKAIAYYRELLQSGCDGLNVLGTTGEAMSFSVDQRLAFMSALAQGPLPRDRIMVGSGAASLEDAARLMRHVYDCGFAAALVMPPFFYRDATDDGIIAFFDVLFARAAPPPESVLLYNFPRMSGITFHPDLVDRLIEEFPGPIAGMKDSSNDSQLQAEVLTRQPKLAVFVGSERDLLVAKAAGAAGCISGSVALWPQLAQHVIATGDRSQAQALNSQREALADVPFIAAVRYLTARLHADDAWERPMPPLRPLTPHQKRALDRAMKGQFDAGAHPA